jgi:hypothetical protein
MNQPPDPAPSPPSKFDAKALRAERVAAALRQNLLRRKAQARARATAEPPVAPDEPVRPT